MKVDSNKRLRASQVKPVTLKRYQQATLALEEWAQRNHKSLGPKAVDNSITSYLHSCCELGGSLVDARSTVYGFILLRSNAQIPEKFQLPKSKEALKGWSKRYPVHSKAGVDLRIWDVIAWYCYRHRLYLAAAAILLQGDTYTRPSELLRVTKQAVILPNRSKSRCWGIIVDPQEQHTATKTGDFDDCVLLDTPGREDLSVVLKCLYHACPAKDSYLFEDMTLSDYNKAISQACAALGLQKLRLTAHVLRHSGPSSDSYHKIRGIKSIQLRGRWKAISSMQRYRKPGRMLLLHQWVPEDVWASADHARQKLIAAFSKPFKNANSLL